MKSSASLSTAESLQEQNEALRLELSKKELELEQSRHLMDQGFSRFIESAEKLQSEYKSLKQKVDILHGELDKKNNELELNLLEKERVKTYLTNIFESQANGVFVTNMAGQILSVNRAGLELAQQSIDDLSGQAVGAVLNFNFSASKSQTPEHFESLLGEPPKTLRIYTALMRDEQGQAAGYLVNVEDITQLKHFEEQAIRRDRFTAMGEMAANIAHEIRNPLGGIELFTSLIKKNTDKSSSNYELLDHISSGVSSMNNIISNLLEYTKPRAVKLDKVSVNTLLEQVVAFTALQAEHNNVKVSINLDAGNPLVQADADHLRQVFHNLILNAIQAMEENGGKLSIQTKNNTQKKNVEIHFADSGVGMPEQAKKNIFDPFYTTKARGTGLGLAIVHSIVEAHHGTISVTSQPNKGSTFRLSFPHIVA